MLNLCFAPISQALFPYLSQKYAKDAKSAISLHKKIMFYVVSVFGIISLVIIMTRNWFVPFMFGSEFASYSNLILILVPQLLLGIVNNFLGVQTLVAVGLQKEYSYCIFANIIVLLVSSFILCPILGAYGIALAAFVAEGVLSMMLFWNCKKRVWRS